MYELNNSHSFGFEVHIVLYMCNISKASIFLCSLFFPLFCSWLTIIALTLFSSASTGTFISLKVNWKYSVCISVVSVLLSYYKINVFFPPLGFCNDTKTLIALKLSRKKRHLVLIHMMRVQLKSCTFSG